MSDTSHSIIVWVLIGALSGGLASFVWRGKPYSIVKDVPLGILGACITSGIAHSLNLTVGNSVFLDVVVSTAGALVALVAFRLFRSN